MPNPTSISLLNYGFRADASKELLTVMLNCPEIDYSTAEEIRRCVKLAHFTQEEIDNAISELKAESLFTKYKSLTEAFMLPISCTSPICCSTTNEMRMKMDKQRRKKTVEDTICREYEVLSSCSPL